MSTSFKHQTHKPQGQRGWRVVFATLVALAALFVGSRYRANQQGPDLSSAKPLQLLATLQAQKRPIAFSPDAKTLASTGGTSTTKLWDIGTGKLLKVIKHRHGLDKLAFSPDGGTLASTSSRNGKAHLELRDAQTGMLLWVQPIEDGLRGVIFSPDGKTLATSSTGGVQLRDAKTGALLKELQGRSFGPFAFSADGTLLARGYKTSGLKNERIEVWDVRTGRMVQKMKALRGWSVPLLSSAAAQLNEVESLVFLADNKTLVVGSMSTSVNDSGATRLWDVRTGSVLQTLPDHEADWTVSMALSPDGNLLAVSSWEGRLYVWNTKTWVVERALVEEASDSMIGLTFHSLTFSSDGKILASGGKGGIIRLWKVS